MTTFDDRLQIALAALENGASLDEALADVPAHEADEMRDLLLLARAMQRVEHPRPVPLDLAALTARVNTSQRLSLTRQVYALAVTALTILIFVGLFVARPLWQITRDTTAGGDSSPTPRAVTATPAAPQTRSATAVPTATPPPQSLLQLGDGPLLRSGPAGSWNDQFVEPFALVEEGPDLYLFQYGHSSDDQNCDIGLSLAGVDDPSAWQSASPDPVLVTEPSETGYVLPGGSVLREASGRWLMLLAFSTQPIYTSPASIYRATAPNPDGPWTLEPDPIFSPSQNGWDDVRVFAPVLLEFEGQYWMFYTGTGSDQRQRIGAATSPDGINWTRIPDPVISLGDLPEPDAPVLNLMDVIIHNGELVLLYRVSQNLAPQGDRYGLARSTDGLTWDMIEAPLLLRRELPSARALYEAELRALPSGALEVYFGMSTGAGIKVNIWQAEFDLP